MAFVNDDLPFNDNKRFSQWAIVLSSIVFALITVDIAGDYRDGVPWAHLLVEVLILSLSLAGAESWPSKFKSSLMPGNLPGLRRKWAC
jgi:hypothetical protein